MDDEKGLLDCWPHELQDLLLTLPTKAANECLTLLEAFHGETFQCAKGGTGGAFQRAFHAEAFPVGAGGFPQHASKGRAGGAFQHAKAAGELYYQVISATWKETSQHIIVSLAVIYSPDDIEQTEKEIDDAKPEDYAILYSELFAKYEAKRIELQDVTKPENNTGKK